MRVTTSPDQPQRGLRLDDDHLTKMLDRLDAHEPDSRAADRQAKRFPYRDKACIAQMMQPGGSAPLAFVVATRNISAGGLSFLHGGFVHSGAVNKLRLVNRFGSWADVEATVVRCRYVDAIVHEVSVAFKSVIDPGDFCPEATTQRVLLAEDSLAMVRIAKHYLESFNTEVVHVTDGRQAVKLASEQEFDLVLMDMDMPVMDGFEAVEKLRAAGCAVPIIAVTGLTSNDTRERCLNLGCDAFLRKPYRREDLARSMAIVRQDRWSARWATTRPCSSRFQRPPSRSRKHCNESCLERSSRRSCWNWRNGVCWHATRSGVGTSRPKTRNERRAAASEGLIHKPFFDAIGPSSRRSHDGKLRRRPCCCHRLRAGGRAVAQRGSR